MIVLFKYLQDQDGRQGRASLGAVALPVLVAVVSLGVPALGRGGAIRPLRAARLAVSPGWLFGIRFPCWPPTTDGGASR